MCADPRTRNAGTVAGLDTISLCALQNSAKVLNREQKSEKPVSDSGDGAFSALGSTVLGAGQP